MKFRHASYVDDAVLSENEVNGLVNDFLVEIRESLPQIRDEWGKKEKERRTKKTRDVQ